MNLRMACGLVVVMLLLCGQRISAAEDDLATAQASYNSQLQAIRTATDKAKAECLTRYRGSLDTLRQAAKQRGELDDVLAVDLEVRRLDAQQTLPPPGSAIDPRITPAVVTGRAAYGKAELDGATQVVTLTEQHLDMLDHRTRQAVRDERLDLARTLKGALASARSTPDYQSAKFLLAEWKSQAAGTPPGPAAAQVSETTRDAGRQESASAAMTTALDGLAAALLAADPAAARQQCDAADRDPALAATGDAWQAAKRALSGALSLRRVLQDSFHADIGRELPVCLASGREILVIKAVDDTLVRASRVLRNGGQVVGEVARDFHVEDLGAAEKMQRVENSRAPAKLLLRGLLAWENQSAAAARRDFEQDGSALGAALVRRLDALQAEQVAGAAAARKNEEETGARQAYAHLLRTACPSLSPDADSNAVLSAIRQTRFNETQISAIHKSAGVLLPRFAATDCARAHASILMTLGQVVPNMPLAVDEATLAKVKNALDRTNPGASLAWAAHMEEDGLVVDLSNNKQLTTIAALAGLPIHSLNLSKTPVADLSPLKGMPLASLKLEECRYVADLRSLNGMKLNVLRMWGSDAMNDLTPLHGMPLTELSGRISVDDLRGLAGMPLKILSLGTWNCTIHGRDFGVLSGMPLDVLNLEGCIELRELRGLAGSSLTHLCLRRCERLADISALRDLPLLELELDGAVYLKDLTPIKGLRLTRLALCGCASLTDLTPLQGLPLQELNLEGCTALHDLAPLSGLPIRSLKLGGSGVVDLTPLRNVVGLAFLCLPNTKVTDVSPLKDLALRQIDLTNTKVVDLAPVRKPSLVIVGRQ